MSAKEIPHSDSLFRLGMILLDRDQQTVYRVSIAWHAMGVTAKIWLKSHPSQREGRSGHAAALRCGQGTIIEQHIRCWPLLNTVTKLLLADILYEEHDLTAHSNFLPWWQLDRCSMIRPFLSFTHTQTHTHAHATHTHICVKRPRGLNTYFCHHICVHILS